MSPLSPVCCSLSRMCLNAHRLVVAASVWLVVSACGHGEIVVFLEQEGGPAQSTPGQQTLITMTLKAQLTAQTPAPTVAFNTDSFAAGIQWSAITAGIGVTDLYTVNSAGTKTISGAAMTADTAGYLYTSTSPSEDMNSTGFDNNDGINLSIFANDQPYPQLSGTVTLATISFAVSENISSAEFSLNLLDTADDPGVYFFTEDGSATAVPFTGTTASLQVVPEPYTLSGALFAVVLSVGWRMKRRSLKPRGDSALSC